MPPLTMKLGGIYAKALFIPANNPIRAFRPLAPEKSASGDTPIGAAPDLALLPSNPNPNPRTPAWSAGQVQPTISPNSTIGFVRSKSVHLPERAPRCGEAVYAVAPRHHRRRSPLSLGGALYRKHRKHAPPENFWRPQVTETTAPWRLLAKNSSNPGCGVSGPLSTPRPRFPVIPPFLVYLTRSLLSGPVRLE